MEPEHQPAARKRRVRYSGTHPRKFQEKYKELNPQKYPETIAQVIASGKTPAGMHRPIMVEEVIRFLAPAPGDLIVDCTLGYGGHAAEALKLIRPGGRLIGLDADPIESARTEKRLREQGWTEAEFVARNANFAALPRVLAELGIAGADAILADLGVSSMQLDDPERGFSFKTDGPLDLRLNPAKGSSAAEWLAKVNEGELTAVLRENSDEKHAELIAATIMEHRSRGLRTTRALADCVRRALASVSRRVREQEGDAPIRRTFQALRIAVNDEFGVLEHLLRVLPQCLKPGGRAVFLTFHSGEDRRVKRSFQEGHRAGIFHRVAEEPIRPGSAEVHGNPRAGSAKLRWATRAAA